MSTHETGEARSTFERVLARRSDALAREQTERAAELVQQGPLQRARPKRVTLARIAGLAVVLLFLRFTMCATPARRGSEPIGAVATADGAGVGSSAAAFLPQGIAKAAGDTAPAAPPVATVPSDVPVTAPSAPAAKPARAPATTPKREAGIGSLPVLVADDTHHGDGYASAVGTPAHPPGAPPPAATPAVINVGTRLRATLEAPLRTGATLVPATATLSEDLRDGPRVLLAAGTRLVGQAFATPGDDRVQILWRALVHDGRTLGIQAETLGPDGGPGLTGKLIRRHRKGVLRRIGSTLAATAGEVAGYAVPLGESALEQAGAALAGRTGRELGQLGAGREWLQADTIVELQAGAPVIVYVAADITFGAAP